MRLFVFLDDERNPEDVTWHPAYRGKNISFIIVRNFWEFREFVDQQEPSQLKDYEWGFDHDLQDFSRTRNKEWTGKDCLDFLLMECLLNKVPLPECHFHTQNVVGKRNMEALYENYKMEYLRRNI